MTLRDDLAGLDELGRALALVAWSTGVPATAPWTVVAAGRLPTLTSAFFAPLPGTLQLDLLADGFAVEGRFGGERPGGRTYTVRDDGSVWSYFPDGRSELYESSVAVLLLNKVLHWIRLHARASLRLEFETDEQLDEYVRQFERLHGSVNHRLGVVVFSWIAGDDVIGFVNEAGGMRPRPTVELLGHSRAAVEQERGEGGASQGWASVERAMEPETDDWSPPYVPFPGHGPREVTGLDDILADAVGVRALERFLDAWYGIELPPAPDHDERPAALARLAQIPNIGALFRDGHLLVDGDDSSSVAAELQRLHPGATPAWAECQYLAIAGYLPDGGDDPPVVFWHDSEIGGLDARGSAALSRFLLRALIDEAIFRSPVCVSTSYVEADEVDPLFAGLTVAIERIDRWGPVLTDGRMLVTASTYERDGIRGAPHVRVAAQRRSDVVESPVGQLPRLDWRYADEARESRVSREAGLGIFSLALEEALARAGQRPPRGEV